ncbi:hypothetical protein GOODEAATRI_014147, partial [Goodea atripinnis]
EAELLKHLAERREHEREVAQKALTKERQEHRIDANQLQMHLNASQEEKPILRAVYLIDELGNWRCSDWEHDWKVLRAEQEKVKD